jgi:succinylglutamate desuccinylase
MSARPRRIAVVGGTHGNEKGGIWVVDEMLRSPSLWEYPGLEITALLANPKAASRNLRYLDCDLNRCFGPQLVHSRPDHPEWERRRALEIQDRLCPQGLRPDLVIDLHNTTSNMGVTWILTRLDPWTLYLASKAQELDARVRILHTPETAQSNIFLPSLGQLEITLEIGPVAHGTHSHWAWLTARDQVRGILNALAKLPSDFDPGRALEQCRFDYFETTSVERYPLNAENQPCALIHRQVDGRDYHVVPEGGPLFFDPFTESTIPHHGPDIYPVFLGEAAYVESGIAYHATRRLLWTGTRGEPC